MALYSHCSILPCVRRCEDRLQVQKMVQVNPEVTVKLKETVGVRTSS